MTILKRSFLVFMVALIPAGSLHAKTYYVRATGDDSKNGMSPVHAWRTLKQAANNVVEGDVAYVGAGTYQEASSTVFNAVGRKDNPVSFIADRDGSHTGDSGDVIVLTPSTGSSVYLWDFQASHHYFITGFTFRRAPSAAASNPYLFGLRLIPTTTKKNTEEGTFAFTNCRFENLYYDVVSLETADVTFTDCVFSGNKYMSLALYNTDTTISNCSFVNGQYVSIYSYGPTSTCEVANSEFTNTANYGIHAWNTTSLLATNNVFSNVRYSLSAYANTSTIEGCTFSLTDAFSKSNWDNWAVQIGSPAGAASCSNCTTTGYNIGAYILSDDVSVTNLDITGLSEGYYNADWTPNTNWKDCYGIVVHGYPNADGTWSYCRRFSYNGSSGTISNCYMGIYTYSSNITISGATISGCMYGLYSSGTYAPGSLVTISNSTIKDCLWNGIAVNQGASLNATNSKFLNNGINKSDGGWGWGWGLSFYGYKAASANYWDGVPGDASLTVQNCEFTGNGQGFCAASFKKELVTLSGNTVDGGLVMNGVTPVSHYGWGACLSNGDYVLQNNAQFSIKNCYYGLGSQYGKISVNNYTIRDNYYGIFLQNSTSADVINCTVTANPGAGVYSTQATSVNVTNSDLSGNGYGFRDSHGKAISLKNSTANNNLYDGIFTEYTEVFAVERCKVLNNANWGLVSYLTKSAAIKNNVVAGNRYGAYLADSGTGAEVWNNTISNNTTNYGVYAAGGIVKVYNNIITGNGAYGLGSEQGTLIHSHNLVSGHSAGTDFWQSGLTSAQAAALRTADEPSKPPRFMDAAAGDYRLAKGSPAINAGMNAPGIVDNDMLGNSRPMFGVTEIGAYEYIDKSGSIRPLTWNERK